MLSNKISHKLLGSATRMKMLPKYIKYGSSCKGVITDLTQQTRVIPIGDC